MNYIQQNNKVFIHEKSKVLAEVTFKFFDIEGTTEIYKGISMIDYQNWVTKDFFKQIEVLDFIKNHFLDKEKDFKLKIER